VFGSLPWLAWQGAWAAVFAVLLAAEIVITIADFIVEDRVRKPPGGLFRRASNPRIDGHRTARSWPT
jgi:hypothetical protein